MLVEKDGLVYEIHDDCTKKHIANIYYSSETGEYRAELLVKENAPTIFNDYIQEKGRVIFGADPNPESRYILNWLRDRVIPENRDMLKDILQANGIYEYDWRVLIRINHGRTTDDDYRVEALHRRNN